MHFSRRSTQKLTENNESQFAHTLNEGSRAATGLVLELAVAARDRDWRSRDHAFFSQILHKFSRERVKMNENQQGSHSRTAWRARGGEP